MLRGERKELFLSEVERARGVCDAAAFQPGGQRYRDGADHKTDDKKDERGFNEREAPGNTTDARSLAVPCHGKEYMPMVLPQAKYARPGLSGAVEP